MVEHYLKTGDLRKLQKMLATYKRNRIKGMNAAILAERVNLPLKDVVSFLIDSNELRGEQVDLELARVMLYKNSKLRNAIMMRNNVTYAELDYALATQDNALLRNVCNQSGIQQAYSLVPQFIIFAGLFSMPYEIAISICAILVGTLFTVAYQKLKPISNAELVIKIFEGC